MFGKGRIRQAGKSELAKIYELENREAIRLVLIPLLTRYKFPYSKMRQVDIFSKVSNLLKKQAYFSGNGLVKLVDYYYEISSYHKKPRKMLKEEFFKKAITYLANTQMNRPRLIAEARDKGYAEFMSEEKEKKALRDLENNRS